MKRKKTLPVVFALTEAEDSQRRTLAHLFGVTRPSPEQVDEVRHHLERLGAREFTQAEVARLTDEAFDALQEIEPAPTPEAQAAFDRLTAMTEFALHRER